MIQDGARLHYALPISLQRAGMLESMYCEWYGRGLAAAIAAIGSALFRSPEMKRLRERRHPELAHTLVHSNPLLVLRQRLARRRFGCSEEYFDWASRGVGRWIRRRGLGNANAIMGFVRNIDPDLCRYARDQGLSVVTDQMIAPMLEEEQQSALQLQRWPDWRAAPQPQGAKIVEAVEAETWASSTHMTCASEYVRTGLIAHGVPAEKVTTLPYPIDAGKFTFIERRGRQKPVVIGFVGAVGLRKGAPYFYEVAKRLASDSVEFVMVGPVQISASAAAKVRGKVKLVGVVPRSEIPVWLSRFDVLLFPSTCEGSAGAVMEAMATGLPVVSTPNSGTVIRHGEEGYLHAYDDLDGLAASVERLVRDESARVAMGAAARKRSEAFNLDWYAQGLGQVFQRVMEHQSPSR